MDGVLIFVRLFHRLLVDLNLFTCIYTDWLVFCCSRHFPYSKHWKTARKPGARISVLSTAVGRDSRPDLGATRNYRFTDFHPISYLIDTPTALPKIPPIIFRRSSERFLVHLSRM